MISFNGRLLDTAHATSRYTKRLMEMDATIARPIFLWGLTISEPLLVIVVNPLNDRMVSATAAIMLVIVASSVLPLPCAGVMEKPATHNPPIAKTTSPIILSRDTIEVNVLMKLLPEILTRNAKSKRPTASTGTR